MSYQHTIALCRDLFSEGHFEAITQIVEPLISREDIKPLERAVLGSLLSGSTLLRTGDARAALAFISPFENLSHTPDNIAAYADVLVWRGWAIAAASTTASERANALSLLSEAQRYARDHHLTGVRCWASVGYGRELWRAGAHRLSERVLADAEHLACALREDAALELINEIRDGSGQVETPAEAGANRTEAGAPPIASVSSAVAETQKTLALAAQQGLPTLLLGEAGVGKAKLVERLAATTRRPLNTIDCATANVDDKVRNLGTMLGAVAENSMVLLRDVHRLSHETQSDLASTLSAAKRNAAACIHLCSTCAEDRIEMDHDTRLMTRLLRQISSVRVFVPPLRDRRDDVEVLVRTGLRSDRPGAAGGAITDSALGMLREFSWPGNDTQLEGLIAGMRRTLAVDPSPVVDIHHLPAWIREPVSAPGALKKWVGQEFNGRNRSLDQILAGAEKALIENTLEETEGHVTAAADRLGLSRQGLYKKMKRLDVDAGKFQVTEVVEDRALTHDKIKEMTKGS